MTRRGSLAYYLAAVVCGTFFVVFVYHAYSVWESGLGDRWAYDFIFAYFISLAVGLFTQLLFAFVLRRVTALLHWQAGWQWLIAGAVAGLAVLWILHWTGYALERMHFPPERQTLKSLLLYPFFVGPMMLAARPFWLPIPAFAATAFVLFRVHRAFDAPSEPLAGS